MLHSFQQKSCMKIQSLLDSYLNNELLVETTHDLLRHLENCPGCAEELFQRERMKALLTGAVIREAVPPALEGRIKKGIRQRPSALRSYLKRLRF